jgi:hypothetical protein
MLLSIHVAGVSSILGAINFITTIFNMRCPGMDFAQDAPICLEHPYYILSTALSRTSPGWWSNYAADGSQF